jgi:hypothetical protein
MPKKVDANQPAVVQHLRECGLHVTLLHTLGKGVPDMVVTGYNHMAGAVLALLVELKNGNGKLTDDEIAWHSKYPADGPLIVARSAEDVLKWFGMTS